MKNFRENKFIQLKQNTQQPTIKGWQYQQNQSDLYANDTDNNNSHGYAQDKVISKNIIKNKNDVLFYSHSDTKIQSIEQLPFLKKQSPIKNQANIQIKQIPYYHSLHLPINTKPNIPCLKTRKKKTLKIIKSVQERIKEIRSVQERTKEINFQEKIKKIKSAQEIIKEIKSIQCLQKEKKRKTDLKQQKLQSQSWYKSQTAKIIYLSPQIETLTSLEKPTKGKNIQDWYNIVPPSMKIKQIKFSQVVDQKEEIPLQNIHVKKHETNQLINSEVISVNFKIYKKKNKRFIQKNNDWRVKFKMNRNYEGEMQFNDRAIFDIEAFKNNLIIHQNKYPIGDRSRIIKCYTNN